MTERTRKREKGKKMGWRPFECEHLYIHITSPGLTSSNTLSSEIIQYWFTPY
jgi:hypothetical protein